MNIFETTKFKSFTSGLMTRCVLNTDNVTGIFIGIWWAQEKANFITGKNNWDLIIYCLGHEEVEAKRYMAYTPRASSFRKPFLKWPQSDIILPFSEPSLEYCCSSMALVF